MTTMANEIELEPLAQIEPNGKPVLSSVLPLLGSVKMRVSVRVGSAHITVAELMNMQQGAVLTLEQGVEQPLDVLVDDAVIARGTLVAVGEQFGVRISETVIASVPAGHV